jgi:apolipoprotein N-acyltransferase
MMALLSLTTLVLVSLIFEPISWWPLAFVCLVPWLILIGGATRAPRVYFHSYVLALAFFLFNMRWLYAATGIGYLALSIYQAVYFPLVALPVRHVVRRRRWPLALALPIVWTGSEMLRAVVISGFPWFFLSHSLHGVLTLIQVSDLVGAYGVSFMVAAVNGAIADVIFASRNSWPAGVLRSNLRNARFSVVFALALVILATVYGQIQLHRGTTTAGPKVAVIQGDYINTVAPEAYQGFAGGVRRLLDSVYLQPFERHDEASEEDKMQTHLSMMEAAAKEKPDLYLLPETPWMLYLNPEARDLYPLSKRSFTTLRQHAMRHNAWVVTGSGSEVPTPNDVLTEERRYNSATVFTPDGSEPERYDKIHLVYFGETVPFRFTRLHFLYLWLNRLAPFSGPDGDFEYSLFRGREFRTFALNSPTTDNKSYRFGIPICYEDVMPYISRRFVSDGSTEKRADFLLNISNDGWFGRGIQQPQHLAICVFRAVENRVGVARAVNTGMSGFIQPTGRVHDLVKPDPSRRWPGNCGYAVAAVGVDSRYTLYARYGDWFAWGCALLWLLLVIDYWIVRARTLAEG